MSNDFSNEIFGAMKRLLFSCLLAVGMVVHAQVGINIDSLMNDMPDVGDNIYISVVVSDKDQYRSRHGSAGKGLYPGCVHPWLR